MPTQGHSTAAMDTPPAIGSRAEFQAALVWGLNHAMANGARRIWCVDRSFTDWPLDDSRWLAPLGAWLKLPQRQLVLLAESYEPVQRQHPRFVAWRRNWAHTVMAWSPQEGLPPLPTLLLDDGCLSVQLADGAHWRGRAQLDASAAGQWRIEIDAFLQRSEAAFPVNSLGL